MWVGWKGETPHKQQSGSVTELLSSAPALYGAGAGPVSGPVRSRRRAGIRPYTEQAPGRYPALYKAGAGPASIRPYTQQAPGRYPALYGAGAGPASSPIRSRRRTGIQPYTELDCCYGAGAGPLSGPLRSRRRTGIRPYTEQAPGRYPAVYGAGAGPVSGPIRSSRRAGIRAYTEHETNLMHRFGSSSSRSSGTGSRRPRCHSRGLPRDRGVSEGRLTVHNQR